MYFVSDTQNAFTNAESLATQGLRGQTCLQERSFFPLAIRKHAPIVVDAVSVVMVSFGRVLVHLGRVEVRQL